MLPIYRRFLRTMKDAQGSDGDLPGAVPGGPLPALSTRPAVRGARTDISWTVAYPAIARRVLEFYGDATPALELWDSLVAYMDGLYEEAQS